MSSQPKPTLYHKVSGIGRPRLRVSSWYRKTAGDGDGAYGPLLEHEKMHAARVGPGNCTPSLPQDRT
jgi:hypothetical protein